MQATVEPGPSREREPAHLATIRVATPISVIVPTFNEAENIPVLLARLDELRRRYDLELEVLVMDDDSKDGTADAVAAFGADWCRAVVRTTDRGLSAAVLDGLRLARHPVLVVMDADLSHPPEAIPAMILALEAGHDFVIGSRYVAGGSTDDDWGVFRWLNSRVATWLSRPLTSAQDPMAGFFALRRADFQRGRRFDPIGYKIGLELIVKCQMGNVGEVPIHFTDRQLGESKLDLREQLRFVQHLGRLFAFKLGTWSELGRFVTVGVSGLLVDLALVTVLHAAGMPAAPAIGLAIAVSMLTNFVVNRGLLARRGPWLEDLTQFVGRSAVGAVVNLATALLARATVFASLPIQLAALVGIAAGAVFNFVANRYGAFRVRHVRR